MAEEILSITKAFPWSEDAEMAFLGSAMMDWERVIPEYRARMSRSWFHWPAHRIIWDVLLELVDDKKPIDPVLVQQRLIDTERLSEVGGPELVLKLYGFLPTAAHAGHYWQILQEKYQLREIIRLATDAVGGCYDEEKSPDKVLTTLETGIIELRRGLSANKREFKHVREACGEVLDDIEQAIENKGHVTRGLGTGFTDLDRTLMGMAPGQLICIAGRPAMGKSAFCFQIAENIALGKGDYREYTQGARPVGYATLEMSTFELMRRAIIGRSGTKLKRIRDGLMSNVETMRITQIATDFVNSPLYVMDASKISIQEFRNQARTAILQFKLEALVIDYLQLMTSTSKRAQANRQQEIGEITSGLKALAKDLGIPIVIAAQLGRSVEDRRERIPVLSDLRESGDIENDCDIVAGIVRPHYYDDDADPELAQLHILKNRNGGTGPIDFKWTGELARFSSKSDRLYSQNADGGEE